MQITLSRASFLYIALLVALSAMLGSLYFSEIAGYNPCPLCWWQRICLYPLVLILATGILRREPATPYFVLPLALSGLGISIYHNLLYWRIIPEAIAPCRLGVSCTTKYIEWFGFITIPLLAFLAFLTIVLCMLFLLHLMKRDDHRN